MKGKMLKTLCIWYTKGVKKESRLVIDNDLHKEIEIYYRGDKSWFSENEILYYINNVLKSFSFTLPKNKKGLIILDGLRAHTTDEVKKAFKKINFIPFFLPPNTTSFLQPNDQLINKHIK